VANVEIEERGGFEFIYSGQVYRVIGISEGDRADGAPTKWARLSTVCPMCGSEFELSSALSSNGLTRRCPPCVDAGGKGRFKPPTRALPVRRLPT
jgi:hypothetical protein